MKSDSFFSKDFCDIIIIVKIRRNLKERGFSTMSKDILFSKFFILTCFISGVFMPLTGYSLQQSQASITPPKEVSMRPPGSEILDDPLPYGAKLFRLDDSLETDEGILHKLIFYTKGYKIDRKYNSMQGPYSMLDFSLLEPNTTPELLWIKGIYSEVVDMKGKPSVLQQFICHVNVNYDLAKHNALFNYKQNQARIVTLSQGQSYADMPEGFGIPILSTEVLKVDTMVMNHNLENPNLDVRHKVTITYYRDRDLKIPMKALYQAVVQVNVISTGNENYLGIIAPHPDSGRPTCHASAELAELVKDQFGRTISGHWVIPPGRQINESLAPMNITYDTTIHRIDIHLHPFAESLELKDITAGKTVFKSTASQLKEGIGLTHVDTFKSTEGIPVFKDHEYALVSVYNNTTQSNSDAMAVMYVHLLNKKFDREKILARLEARRTSK